MPGIGIGVDEVAVRGVSGEPKKDSQALKFVAY
jgi:hypothetical protein